MAKQLNVSLGFSADTSKAKKEIQDLQSMLTKIQTQPAKLFDDVELKKASQAAQDLQHHLNAAINVDTGKLDLNKFSQSLTSSKQKLSDLYKDLSKIGPEGQTAFLQVARSINSADSSALNLGKKLKDLGTSLANTARWQISSSLLHGFMGAVQSAYHYAEDLNSSLNDIRIVTGASVEEMDKFARKANEAARSLSTTTTEYTKASLIFYQQGLSDDEVAKRTEVTIKMANAAGQSAQTVSDQLTAVWNNFYDGSKSLEYYADVMTALGAATASSTDEIAGGLEKFAAIGQTIGLSYEYAASALATITANTRQSEEVVGTALKTIFARIQGLNLGETLDDGTTLNKYSEALQKVGISIFDSTGELKKMDTILDEMGSKWETLNKAQQIALAQTVAGTRQYTQLVALMDNWDKGDSDSMQANLSTAYGAEGALQGQADTYAESWEAARDRVAAAAEQIYASLLDDDFFITILDGFEKFLVGVNSVIDGMGGLKGILLLVGGIFTQHFAKEIPKVLSSIAQNFDVITGKAERNKQAMLEQNAGALEKVEVDGMSDSMSAEVQSITQVSRMTAELNKARKSLSETEIQYYENKIRQVEAYGAEATAIGKENEELKKLIETKKESISKKAARSQGEEVSKLDEEIKKQEELIAAKKRAAEKATSSWEKTSDDKWKAGNAAAKAAESGDDSNYVVYKQRELELSDQLEQKYVAMKEATDDVTKAEAELAKMKEKRAKAGENAKGSKQAIKTELQNLEKVSIAYQSLASEQGKIDKQANVWKTSAKLIGNNAQETNKLKQSMVDYLNHLDSIGLAGDGVDELKSKILDSETSAEQAAQAFDEWRQKAGSIDTTGMENLEQQIDEIESKLRAMGVSQDDLDDLAEQFQTGAITADEYKQALERLQASSSKIPQHIMSASEGFGVFAGKLMQVTSAITALQNIGNIWKDEDASTGQKIMSTMSAMIPIISLVTTLTNKKSLADLGAAASAILQAVGLGGLIAAKEAETVATVAQTGANVGLMASMWPILLVTLLIVAAIGALVAVVWLVVAAFKAFEASTPEGKLKAAKENAEELNDVLEETKKAADDLKAAFDDYDSAVDKLEECTKGTQEWHEALQEVNNEVLDLLSKYPQLATMTNEAGESAISRGKDGEMIVADWARDKLVNSANLAVTNAQTAATLANQDVREAQIVVDTADLRKEIFSATRGISATATTSTTAANGQTYNSPYDAAYIMKDYISKNATKLSGMTPEEQKAFLQEFIDSRNIDTDINAWTKVVTDLGPKFGELAGAIEANTKAIQIENETIASNALADNEAVQASDYAGEITKIVAQGLDQEADKYEQELKDSGWGTDGINKGTGVNDEAKKIFAEYAAAAGITNYDLLDTTGTDKNRKFVYNNGEEEVTVSLEAMRQVVAAQKANADLVADADKLVETLTRLGPEGAAAATAAVTGDASQLTVGQMSGDYDIEAIANDLSEEELKAMGYASAEEFITAFNETVATADEAWEDIVDNYSKTVKKSLRGLKSSGELDNLTLGEAEKFGEALQQAFNTSGQEGIDTLTSMLSDAGDYSDEFANAIDGINWNTATVNDLEIALENAGVECDFTTEELQHLINVMSDGTIVFAEAAEIYRQLHDIIDDLETGDTISAEDFTALKETFGSQMTDYFMQMADGSYKLVGDAEEFYNLVNSYTVENFEKTIDNLNQVEEEINNLLSNYNKTSIQNSTYEKTGFAWGWENAYDNKDVSVNENQIQAQYDFLKNSGYADEDALAEWREGIENRTLTISQLNDMQKAVEENAGSWDQLTEAQQLNNEQINQAQEALASTATNIGELNEMFATGRIDIEEYNKALESITKAEVESYGLDPEEYQEVAEAIQDMGAAGEEWYEELKDDQQALNEATKDATVRYMRMNEAIEDLYDNYEDYSDTLKDVQKAETKTDKALAANTETAKKLRKSIAGLLGVTEDLVDADLLDAISPDDLEAAANGDAAAIERIRNAWIDLQAAEYLGEEAIAGLKDELDNFNDGAMLDLDTMPFLNSLIQAWVDAGLTADQIEDRLSGMNIDADVSPFSEAMAQMVTDANAAGSAVVKSTSITQTAEVVEETTPNTQTGFTETVTPHMRTDWAVMPTALGAPLVYQTRVPYYTKSISFDTESEDIVTPVVGVTAENGNGESGSGGVIIENAHKSSGNKVSTGNSTRTPVGDKGGGGGGSSGSKPSTVEKRDTTSQSDVVERYREVNDAIDNVTDALTRAERATNRLWGKAKFDAMREENKILKEQYELLQEKARQAEEYAKQDATNLRNVADDIGVSLVIDTNTGDITNIEDIEKLLHSRLAAAEAAYNTKVEAYNAAVEAAGDSPTEAKIEELETMKKALDAYEKDVLDGIEDDLDAWEEAEKQFQNSVETWEDAGLEAEDILDQMMQKNFDIWSESLQLEVEVNDKDLELLDYYLSKIEDNVYEMAEAAALMVGNLSSGFEGGQLGEYLDNLSIYGEKYTELTDRLNSTDPEYQITSAQYKEGLDEIQSGLLDNLSSVQELDTAMMEYYGETLSMVGEEIDKYSEKMEHQTSILEHYATMMDILGKSQDYEAMGTILEGQVKTIQNELDVAEAEYNLYAEEAEKKRKLYEEAVASGDAAAAELYKGEWEAAEEAAMEAQSNMLDKTEQWAEAMRAVVENKLQGLAKSLEEALTGGTSFDQINTQLERAASLQEEYLTTTNQIYETNKLMRTAQQEIDKSTNTVAKQRLKDFIKETDQLQDKSKLSKYELDIQKAKYDLLLAEIALEDAQNAKSTVRLQRDSEGNMGYVYTADQTKLAEAQQELEDAQNSLYNIGLEGANDYTEKYAQTMEEMYDTLTSITEAYYNGEITSKEEYDRQMLEAQEYYYQQLEDYQDLYGVALQTDTRVIKDAWSSGFNSMINSTQTWKDKVKVYSDEAAKTMADWYSKVENISTKTGLDNIANKVKDVTDESKALKDTILGVDGGKGVIGALSDELIAVGNLTGGYATLRGTIQGLISDYEKLMTTVNNAQNQQQEADNKNQNGTGGTSGDSDNNNGDTSSNTGNNGNGGSTSGSNAIGTGTGSNEPTISTGTAVTVKRTATHFSRDGGNGTRMRSFVPGGSYNVMEYDDDEVLIGKGGVATGWVKKTDLVGFNTGGYTGSWGSYGKLAILDEKELVLNQNDTANFLASMEVLERILEIIDLQSASAQLGGMLHTPTFGSEDTTQMLEQSVHIEASFPGVSDRNEIEEAFNNLINTASQYANRKW